MNIEPTQSPVGRDSVEPQKLPQRRNPAAGVHIFLDRTTIAFLTVCTLNRAPGLAVAEVHQGLLDAWNSANTWLVGEYVIMPDHIHLFCAPRTMEVSIERWITFWKRQLRRRCPTAPQFQSRGFHHRLRRGEDYGAKWEYVRNNPVRAGLAASPDEWPFLGILNDLPWW